MREPFDEQQALQARQRLLDEGRSVIDRTQPATEQYAAEIQRLNELLTAGAIDQATYARAVEMAASRRSIAICQEPSAQEQIKDSCASGDERPLPSVPTIPEADVVNLLNASVH